jgi:hypothetical protein
METYRNRGLVGVRRELDTVFESLLVIGFLIRLL